MICMALLALDGIGLLSLCGEFGPKLLDMNRLTKSFLYFVFGPLAIYLLQYFIILSYMACLIGLLDWMDLLCFSYTIVITAVCLMFIGLLSSSTLIKKYALGQK